MLKESINPLLERSNARRSLKDEVFSKTENTGRFFGVAVSENRIKAHGAKMKNYTCKILFAVVLAANCLSALPALGVTVPGRVIADDTNFPTSDTLLAGVVYGDTCFSPAHAKNKSTSTVKCWDKWKN
jgi:hypothetical protein